MALDKKVINLPFNGLQTKLDPKLAPIGTYSNLDNFVMYQYPELIKREGLQIIGKTTTPSNITASYVFLNEVGVLTNNSLYSYSNALDQFQLKGLTASPIITAKPIIANTYTQVNCDSAVTDESIIGCVWEDSRGGVRYSVKDLISDTFIVTDTSLSVTGVKPKAVASGIYIAFLWIEPGATQLRIKVYNSQTNTLGELVTISTLPAASYAYDVIESLNFLLIAVVETVSSPNAIKAYYFNILENRLANKVSDGVSDPKSLGFINTGTLTPTISLSTDPDNRYITCCIQNDTNTAYFKSFTPVALTPYTSEIALGSATTDPGWALTSCTDRNNNTYIFLSTKSAAPLHTSYQAKIINNTSAPSVAYSGLFFNQMSIASKAFFYSENAYVLIAYDSPLQATYFGVRDDGACFGRLFSTLAGGSITKTNCLTSFYSRPDKVNTFITSLLKTTKIVASANSFFSTTSVFTEQIFFTPNNIDNKVLGKFLNIAGGYLKQYDGSPTIFEQGFHLYPEKPTAVQSTGSGSIANGTYSYIVVWEWVDNQGQIHRSNTSIPTNIVTTGANNTVTITVRTLPITNKETRFGNTRTNVVMAVYRTLSLGTTYYRVNQLPSTYVYNDPLLNTISFVDTSSDSSISSNSLLYTTGGVVSNVALPSTNLMAAGKNRLFVAGVDTEPNRIFFSKEKEEGVAIEFSNELSVIIDGLGGNITALAAMDDKILIFKESLLFYISGQGPDKVLTGSFSLPQLVSADCGCDSPQSIVLTGMGIMFLSKKGIYLCDRQLSVSYIGQAVERYTNDQPTFSITSAVNLADRNQVFFTTNQSMVLVYDTFFKTWYTHSVRFVPISGSTLDNNWYTSSSSQFYKGVENQAFDADNDAIKSTIKTNWISLANIEGFQRIYAILILGDNATLAHKLVINLYYDFEDYPRETLSITPDSLSGAAYGIDSPYGSGSPFGGTFDGTYQFIVRPKTQKCTSIRIEIFDEFPEGDRTQSFKFSGISIVAGMKSGYNKNLSYTRRLT